MLSKISGYLDLFLCLFYVHGQNVEATNGRNIIKSFVSIVGRGKIQVTHVSQHVNDFKISL